MGLVLLVGCGGFLGLTVRGMGGEGGWRVDELEFEVCALENYGYAGRYNIYTLPSLLVTFIYIRIEIVV